jgi:hypothetical protein
MTRNTLNARGVHAASVSFMIAPLQSFVHQKVSRCGSKKSISAQERPKKITRKSAVICRTAPE